MGQNLATQTRVLDAQVRFIYQPFLRPLHLSSGDITEITEAVAEVRVLVNGREHLGRGSIYLSDLWAWPHPTLLHDARDAYLRQLCETISGNLAHLCGGEEAHPLELGLRLHDAILKLPTPGDPPPLARALCSSPFDAAIHDAVGIALQCSAFDLYHESVPLPSADPFFESGNACEAISRTLRKKPVSQFDAWLVVSGADNLETEVAPWIRERGYHAFKVKLKGRDALEDAHCTSHVFQEVRRFGVALPRLCVDANCATPDAEAVLAFLECLRREDAEAYTALEYLEQPTGRDIEVHSNDWRPVTQHKPVLLDEGLTGLEIMEVAREQGWSGFALKTCKGQSVALTAAAWAQEAGMQLALQDLTNPGISAIHAALFAAYVPTINGIELNSAQFTPAANADWLPRLASLLDPYDGIHHLPSVPFGLGSGL